MTGRCEAAAVSAVVVTGFPEGFPEAPPGDKLLSRLNGNLRGLSRLNGVVKILLNFLGFRCLAG